MFLVKARSQLRAEKHFRDIGFLNANRRDLPVGAVNLAIRSR